MTAFPEALDHGPLLPVCDGVWAVRGRFRMGPGVVIGRTMTVVRGPDGLVLLNTIRLTPAGEAALDALGPVRHVVKLADTHGVDEPYALARYGATWWILPGARTDTTLVERLLTGDGPVPGGRVLDLVDRPGLREAAYLVPHGGGTLVAVDAVQVHVDDEGTSWLGRLAGRAMGFTGGVIVPPFWRRKRGLAGPAVAEALRPVTDAAFAHLVTGHGPPVVGGADAAVRAAVARAAQA